MKKLAFFVCFTLAALLSGPAHAYDTPVTDPQGKKMIEYTAKSVENYTEMFEMKKLVWANVVNAGQIIQLQYMPEGLEDPNSWTRMLEISVYGLSGDPKSDMDAQKKIIKLLETQYTRAAGSLMQDENYLMNENKDIGMFIRFRLNAGTPQQMDGAGAYLRITDKAGAYIQLNGRGRPLKTKESLKVHKLVNPLAEAAPKQTTP